MTLAEFLFYACCVVFIVVNLAVAAYAFPAYRRHREKAFLLLGISGLLGVFTTVFDYTVGIRPMSQEDYYWWWCSRQAVGIQDSIGYGIAVVLLIRRIDPEPTQPTLRDYVTESEHPPAP